MDAAARTASQLAELGFSHYEARAYIGLLGQEPMTGYALANRTQIPQPKVYETLRRLVEKHAAVKISADPARFVAVPAEHLLTDLDTDFRRRVADVKDGLAELGRRSGADELRVLRSLRTWPAVAEHATRLLDAAQRHVYLSLHADQRGELDAAVRRADARGVRLDVLCFGPTDLTLNNGRVLAHASTAGMVYRHHQARHLALVADSQQVLWALAADGAGWDAVVATDGLLAAVVKGYVRHDLYVQEIFADFPAELQARYGAGLEGLVGPYADAAGERHPGVPDPRDDRRQGPEQQDAAGRPVASRPQADQPRPKETARARGQRSA